MAGKQRTPEQIRADIAASRHAMSVGIEGLVTEVHPTALKQRAIDEVKQTADDARAKFFQKVDDARTYFVDEGGVRWNNVGTVALIAVGVVGVLAAVSGAKTLVRRAIR